MKRTTPKYTPYASYRQRLPEQPYVVRGAEPECQQAQRIFARVGGPAALAFALNKLPQRRYHRDRTIVYKWGYPRSAGGTGGYIPPNLHLAVNQAARFLGVILTTEDWRL